MAARVQRWVQGEDAASVARIERWLIGALLCSALLGMAGGTWDAAWHVSMARETFWSPPHLLLYAGTVGSVVVGSLGTALARLTRRPTPSGFAVVAIGGLVVVGAAPLDELWHRTFGRDVDVWSFPHLVALGGGIAVGLGAAMAVEAHRRGASGWAPGHRAVAALFLAIVLWSAMFGLNWYTLVLAAFRDSVKYPLLACLVGSPVLVLSAIVLGRGGATAVSALYMAYTTAAHGLLAGLGYALLPFPPMLLAPALALDGLLWDARGRGWRRAAVAGLAFAPAFYLGEAASLAWLPHTPLEGPPVGALALGYYLERLDRSWDLAHVALALPFAMGLAALGGLVGWGLGHLLKGEPLAALFHVGSSVPRPSSSARW